MPCSTSKKKLEKNLKNSLIEKSKEFGFDVIKITKPNISKENKDYFDKFLFNNFHGEMDWLENKKERRKSPKKLWNDVESIIMLGVNYGPDHDPLDSIKLKNTGNISVYAKGNDYHDIIKKNLKKLGRWFVQEIKSEIKVFVDTAPVMEKPLAQKAGLGWQGKHTNLVSREFGSWLFLGSIYTNIIIDTDEEELDHCGNCTSCIDICPTQAFPEPYKLDARKCISYLTIEHKGPIPINLRSKIGNRIYGCDDCLAICPWNKFAKESNEMKFSSNHNKESFSLKKLSLLDDRSFRLMFSKSPIKRIGRDRFLRNVLIALGNSKSKSAAHYIKRNLGDKSPIVRGAAVWAINQILKGEEINMIKNNFLPLEQDINVINEWNYN
jgi:epoxyqueuosine reductase